MHLEFDDTHTNIKMALEHGLHEGQDGQLESYLMRLLTDPLPEGLIVGLAYSKPEGPPLGIVLKTPQNWVQIYVAPGYRGSGIASALVGALKTRTGLIGPTLWAHPGNELKKSKNFWNKHRILVRLVDTTVNKEQMESLINGTIDVQYLKEIQHTDQLKRQKFISAQQWKTYSTQHWEALMDRIAASGGKMSW